MIILWQAFMFFVIGSAIYGAWKWFHFSLLMPTFSFIGSIPEKIRVRKKQRLYREFEQQKLQLQYLREVYTPDYNPEQLITFRQQIFGTPPRPWLQGLTKSLSMEDKKKNYYYIMAEMIGTREAVIINKGHWSKEKDEFLRHICPEDLKDMIRDHLVITMERKAMAEFDEDDIKKKLF